jgi:uncharacterized membrane protein YkoI
MKRRSWIAAAGLGVAAIAGAGIAAASASGDDEGGPDDDGTERAITGEELERASEAALAHTGGGRVTGSEIDDEESKYEIEVTLENGDQIDVQLDEEFKVVSMENDGAGDDD